MKLITFSHRLRKLPPQYNAFEVKENLARMGALLPMNIFLRFVTFPVKSSQNISFLYDQQTRG